MEFEEDGYCEVPDEVHDKIAHALSELPDERFDLAAYLTERGIKGKRMKDCECPLAHFLQQTSGVAGVAIGDRWIKVDGQKVGEVPYEARRFTEMFDEGEFPELEE